MITGWADGSAGFQYHVQFWFSIEAISHFPSVGIIGFGKAVIATMSVKRFRRPRHISFIVKMFPRVFHFLLRRSLMVRLDEVPLHLRCLLFIMAISASTSHCQPPRPHISILNKVGCPYSARTAEQFILFAVRCGYAYQLHC